MSGIEVAGLAFGVLPVVIEIVKSYKTACERLHTFRTYSKAIQRIQLRFRTQESNFRNECRHLFRLIIEDGQEAQDILQDPAHSRWRDSGLDEKLEKVLGSDYELCEDILKQIQEIVKDVRTELSKISSEKPNGELKEETIQRLRQAITISFKETYYEKKVADLQLWISYLSNLRSHHCELQQERSSSRACITRKYLPSSITAINQASHKLHDSLKEAWSCTNISHTGHQAKLCVNAKIEGGVCLDMAISCRLRDSKVIQVTTAEPPIWLYVQSTTLRTHSMPPALPPVSMATELAGILDDQKTGLSPSTPPKSKRTVLTALDDLKQGAKKRMKVRFADAGGDDAQKASFAQQPEIPESSSIQPPSFNLRQTHSICCHLKQAIRSAGHNCKGTCLGYLETPDLFKLIFYDAGAKASPSSPPLDKETISLVDSLQNLPMASQLDLAHKLATAVLQYHSTPWLPQDWHLQDFSFFGDRQQRAGQDSQDLRTLHVSTQFPEANKPLTQPMEGVESNGAVAPISTMQDIQDLYGISNMTLASLGLALLEIGLRGDVQSLRRGNDPHEVVTARKLLIGLHTQMGPKYQDIVRRCIQCDFAFGTDLSKKELQSAVYSDVVCPLEDMIKAYQSLTLV